MKNNPLVTICIFFCLGIWIGSFFHIPLILIWASFITFLSLAIIRRRNDYHFSFLLLLTVLLLGLLHFKNFQTLPQNHIAKLTPYKGESCLLTGIIDTDPVYKNKSVSFTLSAERVKFLDSWQVSSGKVLVRAFKRNKFSYGDKITLEGKLYRPFSFARGSFNYREYLKHQGVYSILSAKRTAYLKFLDSGLGNPIKSIAFRIREKIESVISKNLSPEAAGIFNAIILGKRQNLAKSIRDDLVKSGSVHIIAISGLHIGIVAFIVLAVLCLFRVPRKARYTLTIFFLIAYCIITGARVSVVRATTMAVILLIGFILNRQSSIYNSLAVAALLILIVNPYQIFEVSFQLSFISVISIISLAPKIEALFSHELLKINWLRFLILSFSVSSAAFLGLLPLIIYYFRIVTPVSVLANMVIVPFMSIIVASGFTLALVGILASPLAYIFAAASEVFILILFKINSFFIAIPGAYFKLPRISFAYVVIYYAIFILVVNFSRIRRCLNRKEG